MQTVSGTSAWINQLTACLVRLHVCRVWVFKCVYVCLLKLKYNTKPVGMFYKTIAVSIIRVYLIVLLISCQTHFLAVFE